MSNIINDSSSQTETSGQMRCYLCEIPKKEYSIVRSFSEVVCRGCINFEGPDRVESLISEARSHKLASISPSDCIECYKSPNPNKIRDQNSKTYAYQARRGRQPSRAALNNQQPDPLNRNQSPTKWAHDKSKVKPANLSGGLQQNGPEIIHRVQEENAPSSLEKVDTRQSNGPAVKRAKTSSNPARVDEPDQLSQWATYKQHSEPRADVNINQLVSNDNLASNDTEKEGVNTSSTQTVSAPKQTRSSAQAEQIRPNATNAPIDGYHSNGQPIIMTPNQLETSHSSNNQIRSPSLSEQANYIRTHQQRASNYHPHLGFNPASSMMFRQLNPCGQPSVFGLSTIDRSDMAPLDAASLSNRMQMNQRHMAAVAAAEVASSNGQDAKIPFDLYGSNMADLMVTSAADPNQRNQAAANWIKRNNQLYHSNVGINSLNKPMNSYPNAPISMSSFQSVMPPSLSAMNFQSSYQLPGGFYIHPQAQQSSQMQFHSPNIFSSQFRNANSQFSGSFQPSSNEVVMSENDATKIRQSNATRDYQQLAGQMQRQADWSVSDNQASSHLEPTMYSSTISPNSAKQRASLFGNRDRGSSNMSGLMQLAEEAGQERTNSPDVLSTSGDYNIVQGQPARSASGSPVVLNTKLPTADRMADKPVSFASDTRNKTSLLPRVSPISPVSKPVELAPFDPNQIYQGQSDCRNALSDTYDVSSGPKRNLRQSVNEANSGNKVVENFKGPKDVQIGHQSTASLTRRQQKEIDEVDLTGGNNNKSVDASLSKDPKCNTEGREGATRSQFRSEASDRVRCLTCGQPLADQDFVQCPSKELHKFCFPCSKASIQRQQAESRRDPKSDTKGKLE